VDLLLLTTQAEAQTSQRLSERPQNPTYEAVVAGMTCHQSSNQITGFWCEYAVGGGLRFVIAGVGQPDAAVTVEEALGYDSDYYFTFGVGHGCVIVKPGKLALRGEDPFPVAFVSPVTGKVYQTWQECKTAAGSQ